MKIERREIEAPTLSNVVAAGPFVFTAGCIADDATQDIRGQTRQALADVDRYLEMCGTDKSKIVSALIWLTDIRNRDAMNEAWLEWVDPNNLPARACVEARLANPQWLVEIMVVAAR